MDLRIVKTRENIREAFLSLLNEKSIEKIKVTELIQKARISKGTFYLHYRDVYDLYREIRMDNYAETYSYISDWNLFIDDPEEFMKEFGRMTEVRKAERKRIFPRGSHVNYQNEIMDHMRNMLLATGRIRQTPEMMIKLDCVLFGLLEVYHKYEDTAKSQAEQVIADMIRGMRLG